MSSGEREVGGSDLAVTDGWLERNTVRVKCWRGAWHNGWFEKPHMQNYETSVL